MGDWHGFSCSLLAAISAQRQQGDLQARNTAAGTQPGVTNKPASMGELMNLQMHPKISTKRLKLVYINKHTYTHTQTMEIPQLLKNQRYTGGFKAKTLPTPI